MSVETSGQDLNYNTDPDARTGAGTVGAATVGGTAGIVYHAAFGGQPAYWVYNGQRYSDSGSAQRAKEVAEAQSGTRPVFNVASSPTGTPGQTVAVNPAGTNVRDHANGYNYVAGSVNDPNLFGGAGGTGAAGARDDLINNLMTTSQQRTAPQATGSTLGPMQQAGVAQMSPLQQAQQAQLAGARTGTAATLGPAAQAAGGFGMAAGSASAAHLGPAERAQFASIDPLERANAAAIPGLERAQDSSLRAQQQAAIDYQGSLMRGENSVAAMQAKRMRDQAMRQQLAMAASARPGQGAMAQRVAAQQQARISADIAGRTLEAQLAERNAAANMFGQMASAARGQDIGLNQFNAQQGNQQNQMQAGFQQQAGLANASAFNQRAQQQAGLQQQAALQNAAMANQQAQVGAQLGTQASIANAANQTQAGIAQGQMQGQMAMFNAGQTNAQQLAQAQMAQQMGLANMSAENQRAFEQAQMFQQGQQFNTSQGNAYNLAAAQMQQQGNQFDASQTNAAAMEQARLSQQSNQFNVGAGLQQQGMNDQMMANLLSQQLGGMQLTQQQQLAIAGMLNQQKLTQMAIDGGKPPDPSLFQNILGGGATGAGAGAVAGPWGALIGGVAGVGLGIGNYYSQK